MPGSSNSNIDVLPDCSAFSRTDPMRCTPLNTKRATKPGGTAVDINDNIPVTVLRRKTPKRCGDDETVMDVDQDSVAKEVSTISTVHHDNASKLFVEQQQLLSEVELRNFAQEKFGHIVNFKKLPDYCVPPKPRKCESAKCEVCKLIEKSEAAFNRLATHNIYPKFQEPCTSAGTYCYSNEDDLSDTYAGHTEASHKNNHFAKTKNWNLTEWKSWSFVAMPSIDPIMDLLLEDILIILLNGKRNSFLNIYDIKIPNRKLLKEFVNKNPEFKVIYTSRPFMEFVFKQELPMSFQNEDLSVVDLIKELLPCVNIGEPVPTEMWYKPPLQKVLRKKKDDSSELLLHYENVRNNGSKGALRNEIQRGQMYGMKICENFVWQFQKYANQIFETCEQNCTACVTLKQFVVSEFHEITMVLDRSDIHHLLAIMLTQQTVAIDHEVVGNSKDTSGHATLRFWYVRFRKVNIERQDPTICPKLFSGNGKHRTDFVFKLAKERMGMYHLPGTHPCNKAYNGSSNDPCKTCPLIPDEQNIDYLNELEIQILGNYSCKSHGIYTLIHRTEPKVYLGSTGIDLCTRNKSRRSHIKNGDTASIENMNDYDNVLIGTSDTEEMDRYLEDAFTLYHLTQNKYNILNRTLNVLTNKRLFFEFICAQSTTQKWKLFHLYSTKLFFQFLFKNEE